MKTYTYATDGEAGTIEASDFSTACEQLAAMVTWEALFDGGWGWVQDSETGERYERGPLTPDDLTRDDLRVLAAIDQSARRGEIVYLPWSEAAEEAIRGECEDAADAIGLDDLRPYVDAWGVTEEGRSWRVRLTWGAGADCRVHHRGARG